MKTDSITLAIIAIFISSASVLLSLYTFFLNRKLDYSQICGELRVWLTSKAIEVLAMLDALHKNKKHRELYKKLLKIAQGMVKIREELKDHPKRIGYFAPFLITRLSELRHDVNESAPVFESLKDAFDNKDLNKMSGISDGLIERFYGRKSKPVK